MMFKISKDKNGNKIVTVSAAGVRGFSIQTNGNLPNTHRNNSPDVGEICEWVRTYGTLRQKHVMEVCGGGI
jgi:hypothetical protein